MRRDDLMLSTFGRQGLAGRAFYSTIASGAYVAANMAHYYPFELHRPATIRKLWWCNGATPGTDNVQMGVYLPDGSDGAPGTALIRGTSTLAAGSQALQYDDIADTVAPAGRLWLAFWASGTTTQVWRTSVHRGIYVQASLTGGLPATATPVQASGSHLVLCGMQLRAAP